jgi:sugar lactone lactonase YvrE
MIAIIHLNIICILHQSFILSLPQTSKPSPHLTDVNRAPFFEPSVTGKGELNLPLDLAVDAQGYIYVADHSNHRVVVYGTDGKLVRTIGSRGNSDGQLQNPRGVAVDGQGNVYV